MMLLQIDPINNEFTKRAFNISPENVLGYALGAGVTLFICAIGAIIYLYKQKNKDKESFIASSNNFTGAVNKMSDALVQHSGAINNLNQTQERHIQTLNEMSKSISKFEGALENMNDTLREIRLWIIQKS